MTETVPGVMYICRFPNLASIRFGVSWQGHDRRGRRRRCGGDFDFHLDEARRGDKGVCIECDAELFCEFGCKRTSHRFREVCDQICEHAIRRFTCGLSRNEE